MRFIALFVNMIAAGIMFSSISHAEYWEVLGELEAYRLAIEIESISSAVAHDTIPSGMRTGWGLCDIS